MKTFFKWLSLLLFVLPVTQFTEPLYAQPDSCQNYQEVKAYFHHEHNVIPDIFPGFPGGTDGLLLYIARNIVLGVARETVGCVARMAADATLRQLVEIERHERRLVLPRGIGKAAGELVKLAIALQKRRWGALVRAPHAGRR